MSEERIYDLEARTGRFSLRVRDFCLELRVDVFNRVYISQVLRSAGSAAVSYIETSDNLGDKDSKHQIKICKKESRETKLWMKHLLIYDKTEREDAQWALIQEGEALMKIFAAILRKLGG